MENTNRINFLKAAIRENTRRVAIMIVCFIALVVVIKAGRLVGLKCRRLVRGLAMVRVEGDFCDSNCIRFRHELDNRLDR